MRAAVHAVPVSAVVLGLFYHWFAVADRYAIFLYGHLGAGPFDRVTRSRYWMAGLVAAGMVMVGYGLVNWILGRVTSLSRSEVVPGGMPSPTSRTGSGDPARARLRPFSLRNGAHVVPAWWQVWALCAPALTVGIPLITTRVNEPTLPPGDALACTAAALVGLAFALMPGAMAAARPGDLVWTAVYGVGLMPALLLVRALELPGQGLIGPAIAWGAALGGTLAGAVWLALITVVGARRGEASPKAEVVLVSGLCVSYLLMPVVHHVLATPPGYHYISASSNFFANHVGLQLLALVVAALLAVGVTRLREWRAVARFARGRRPDRVY